MTRKEIFCHYSQILDELIDSSPFYKFYFQSCCTLDEDIIINDHLTLCTGISRACIVDSNYDYVIKINFDGLRACEKEINIYENAQYEHMEQFFARPIPLGTYTKEIYFYSQAELEDTMDAWYTIDEFKSSFDLIKNDCTKYPITLHIPLFAYPRANFPNLQRHSANDARIASNSISPLKTFSLAIAASFINDYGKDNYEILSDFLYNWNIGDIHLNNVGEINNHICIIDYAGIGDSYVSNISRYS